MVPHVKFLTNSVDYFGSLIFVRPSLEINDSDSKKCGGHFNLLDAVALLSDFSYFPRYMQSYLYLFW